MQQSEDRQQVSRLAALLKEDTTTMDIALKKFDLIQRLMQVWDEATLQRIAKAIEEAVPDEEGEFTDDDRAELERRRAAQVHGEGKSYTKEKAIALLRKAVK